MRIAGYIEDPEYKITIMHMNHRYALKVENEGFEQTYKIRESDYIANAGDIKKIVNPEILIKIKMLFKEMEAIKTEMLLVAIPDDGDFEEII